MKKYLLLLAVFFTWLGSGAFNVGDASYIELPDGTVQLEKYKKAKGDIVVPATVSDPKTGKTFTVSGIGAEAFKKTEVISVELPESVTAIGAMAFSECKNLQTVKLPSSLKEIPEKCFAKSKLLSTVDLPQTVVILGERAFSNCNSLKGITIPTGTTIIPNSCFEKCNSLTEISIPGSVDLVDYGAFYSCANLNKVVLEESDKTLKIANYAFSSYPIRTIEANRFHSYVDDIGQDPFKSAENIETLAFGGAILSNLDKIKLSEYKSYNIIELKGLNPQTLSREDFKKITDFLNQRKDSDYNKLIVNGETDSYAYLLKLKASVERNEFNNALRNWMISVANEPEGDVIDKMRKHIPQWGFDTYRNYVKQAIVYTVDSLYFKKNTLTTGELKQVESLIFEHFRYVGYDYGHKNMLLPEWASHRILDADLENGNHKDIYEWQLTSIEKYFKYIKKSEHPAFHAMQLAALCGLERWKEAASYYPKVHRAVTENGQFPLPNEFNYIKDVIEKQGFNVVTPTYSKTKASKKGGGNNDGLIEFFTEKIVSGAINHHQKKKEEKRLREMLDVDKKGRPRK